MNKQSIWEILGINPTDNQREIRKAYAMQSRTHHLEEDPEEFAELNNAYQQALSYAAALSHTDTLSHEETLPHAETAEADKTGETENSLLARLALAEEESIQQSRKEGALRELIMLVEDTQNGKKTDCWRTYFLSEAFLNEQFDEKFGRGLVRYLRERYGDSEQTFDNVHPDALPPRPFIVELTIAYGLYPDAYGDINAEGSFYNRMLAGKLWNICSAYWNFPEEIGPERILMRAENLVRLCSFSDYLTLKNLNHQGYLTEKEKKIWEPVLLGGKSNNLYEKNGKKSVYPETRSIILLSLYTHWINTESVPYCICKYIYREYTLNNLEHSSSRDLYLPLKLAILNQYPHIEHDLFDQDSKEQMIRSWYQELMKIISDYHSGYDRREYAEPPSIRSRVETLFSREEWTVIQHEPALFDRMYNQIARRKVMPQSLAEKLCAFYQEEYPWPQPQQVQEMQEGLVISMSFHQQLLEMDYRTPYVYQNIEVSDIHLQNRDFWLYFLMTGFDCRSYTNVAAWQNRTEYAVGNELYLPAYIQTIYLPSMEWRKKFTGFDDEENAVLTPKTIDFLLPDGRRVKAEFHLHYIRYFLEDTPLIDPAFTFTELQNIMSETQETPEKTILFFFLLAITAISEDERESAEKEIENQLNNLPLAAATLPLIAKMLAADNARSPVPEKETRRIQAVFYEEQERFCFKAEVYLRGLKTYRKTNFGWEEITLLDGEGKAVKALDIEGKKQYAVQKLTSMRQPKPILLHSYSLENLDNEAKMRRIIDALKEQEQYRRKRTVPYAPGFPWSPEEITPAVREFFAEDGGWMLESYVILQMGLQKNPCFERIFYSKMNIFGFDLSFQSPEFVETLNSRTGALSQKIKEKHLVVGHFGWGKSYEARHNFAPMPFAVGESKTFYAYDFLRLYKAETLEELMARLFDFSEVSRVDVYANRLSVSRLDHELDYCYTEEDFEYYLHSKTKKLPEIFTKFGI